MFYECQDQSNRIALGDPLINPGFEESQDFEQLLQEADKTSSQLPEPFKGVCAAIKEQYFGHSLTEAFTKLTGLPKQVSLLILSLLFPELSTKFANLATIPLDKFTLTKDARVYLDALIKSGVAADVERGVVFIIGKSGVGKSSFANTFKRFIENQERSLSQFSQKTTNCS